MTALQIWELIFAAMSGIGGVGSVIVGIKKDKESGTDKSKTEES